MFSLLFPVLTCFIITFLLLMQNSAGYRGETPEYVLCSLPFKCAALSNLTYPFWRYGRQDYCGHPSFKLNCEGSVPLITILSTTYRVLQIDSFSQTLKVAREDLLNTTCPATVPNTTIDFNLFTYVSYPRLSLYMYSVCPRNSTWSPMTRRITCRLMKYINSTIFYVIGNASTPVSNACETSTVVPLDQSAAAKLLSNPSDAETDLREALESGFDLRWKANNTLCDLCVRSGGLCGHDPISKSFACHCADRTYDYTCGSAEDDTGTGHRKRHSTRSKIAIELSICMAVIVVLSLATIYFKEELCWKKGQGPNHDVQDFFRNYESLAPKQYGYSEIKRITNFFTDKLGQGGFGSVFKGKLRDGRLVAVKVLSETKGDGEEFLNEVASISKTSHVNVVNLLGFCYEKKKRALIYEFMPNGSLDKLIYKNGTINKDNLDWDMLHKIAVGIARGLEYLHGGCNTRIVHFDIKPHNILLDEQFFPKISDFGLAKLCERKESLFSMLGTRGTPGYIAPEVFCRNFGGVSHRSDVYSYGMLVLEMVGLRRKTEADKDECSEAYFPDWIYEHLELGKDLGLEDVKDAQDQEAARKMILVGLWCIQTKPSDRPSINRVVEMLEGSVQCLPTPPKLFLDSPALGKFNQESGTEISTSYEN